MVCTSSNYNHATRDERPLKLVEISFSPDENTDTTRQQQHLYVSKQQIQAILLNDRRTWSSANVEMRHEAEKVVQKYIKSCEKRSNGGLHILYSFILTR